MTNRKKILLIAFSALAVAVLFCAHAIHIWTFGTEEERNGLQQGVSRSAATDCPIDLPTGATDIYYAYNLYWQGGCSIARYRFPTGDLKKQAEKHLRTAASWNAVNLTRPANVPEHRFSKHRWFDPTTIATGYESSTPGFLWQPKVWIDDANRLIYVIDQN